MILLRAELYAIPFPDVEKIDVPREKIFAPSLEYPIVVPPLPRMTQRFPFQETALP